MSRRGFGIIVFLLFVDTKPYQPCKVLRRNDADLQMKVSCLSQALEEIPSQYRNEHVVELDVSLNKITSLENSSFAGYDDVKIVKLDNNEIYTIADDAFRYLKKLITVSLAGNNMTSITPDLFADCSSLKTLILKGNNFNHLSLQQHSFLVSSTLASLDLSFCQLEQLPATFFSETPKLAIIDVGHNYLKSIRPETFQWLKHLTYVKLKGNPLQCTCELRETLSRFQERNISVRPASMQCSLGSEKVKLASFISGNSCQAEVTRQQTSEVPVHTEQPSTTEYSQRIVASQKSRHTETAPPDDADKTSTTENDPVKENSEEDSAALSQKVNKILEQQENIFKQISEMKVHGDAKEEQRKNYPGRDVMVWPYLVGLIGVFLVAFACYHQRRRIGRFMENLFNNRQKVAQAPDRASQDESSPGESTAMVDGETPSNIG